MRSPVLPRSPLLLSSGFENGRCGVEDRIQHEPCPRPDPRWVCVHGFPRASVFIFKFILRTASLCCRGVFPDPSVTDRTSFWCESFCVSVRSFPLFSRHLSYMFVFSSPCFVLPLIFCPDTVFLNAIRYPV